MIFVTVAATTFQPHLSSLPSHPPLTYNTKTSHYNIFVFIIGILQGAPATAPQYPKENPQAANHGLIVLNSI